MAVGLIAYVTLRLIFTLYLRKRYAGQPVEEDEPVFVQCFWLLGFVGAAFTAGASFFGTVIYLIDHSLPALIAPGLGILLFLVQLPTHRSYRSFLERMSGSRPA